MVASLRDWRLYKILARTSRLLRWRRNEDGRQPQQWECFLYIMAHEQTNSTCVFKKNDFIYLFLERGKGERKRGRETSMCGCLSHTSHRGPGLQPRHVPWLGIEPAILWFTGQHSIHWATPARCPHLSLCWYMRWGEPHAAHVPHTLSLHLPGTQR